MGVCTRYSQSARSFNRIMARPTLCHTLLQKNMLRKLAFEGTGGGEIVVLLVRHADGPTWCHAKDGPTALYHQTNWKPNHHRQHALHKRSVIARGIQRTDAKTMNAVRARQIPRQ